MASPESDPALMHPTSSTGPSPGMMNTFLGTAVAQGIATWMSGDPLIAVLVIAVEAPHERGWSPTVARAVRDDIQTRVGTHLSNPEWVMVAAPDTLVVGDRTAGPISARLTAQGLLTEARNPVLFGHLTVMPRVHVGGVIGRSPSSNAEKMLDMAIRASHQARTKTDSCIHIDVTPKWMRGP